MTTTTHRWELELKAENAGRQPDIILGRAGTAWAIADTRRVSFTVFRNGAPVLELRHCEMLLISPDVVELDEALRRIPALDSRSPAGEIQRMLDDPESRCFVEACDNTDVDRRGPVFLRPHAVALPACREHWEAIHMILGNQATTERDRREAIDAAVGPGTQV